MFTHFSWTCWTLVGGKDSAGFGTGTCEKCTNFAGKKLKKSRERMGGRFRNGIHGLSNFGTKIMCKNKNNHGNGWERFQDWDSCARIFKFLGFDTK